MDADVLYDPSILADVAALERGFALDPRTDPGRRGDDARRARPARCAPSAAVASTGFDLVGEGVGFFKLDRASLPALRRAIDASDPEGDYEAALDLFLGEHGADYVLVGDRPWIEIDFPEDVKRAERDILPLL